MTLSCILALGASLLGPAPGTQDAGDILQGQGAPPAQQPQGKQDQKPAKPQQIKPYNEVITEEAVTQTGIFKVHRIDDKLFFEIPVEEMNKDMLFQTEISELQSQVGYIASPIGARVVRWVRRNDKVYLEGIDYSIRAAEKGGIETGIKAASLPVIIDAFDVKAEGPRKEAVIDVTKLYSSDPSEFSVKEAVGGLGLDPGRSYIDRATAFPINVEVRSMLTFAARPRGTFPETSYGAAPGLGTSVTALVHYSLVKLPEQPMMPRYRDPRVGYFATIVNFYGGKYNGLRQRDIIQRFRLEKKDPTAPVSDVVKPITFYMAREVPDRWRPYVKKAVEEWKPVFEKAGFRNAIECRMAPSVEEDPTWDPEDARYNVIRWPTSPIQNAIGPGNVDPRSGEVINSHIIFWHNVMKIFQGLYFTEMAQLDPRARQLPFPDDLTGELIACVVTHEVGHTLGLEHNMEASSTYTIAQLRNPDFVRKNDISASIMDYARFNYVAQPGDKVPFQRKIGPYDYFAINWGYRPIRAAQTPEQELPILNQWANQQLSDPKTRFGNYKNPWDPYEESEDLSNDAMAASALAKKNINRNALTLLKAGAKPGEDYTLMGDVYQVMASRWLSDMFHVTKYVGGVIVDDYKAPVGKPVQRVLDRKMQSGAVRFLCSDAGAPPVEMLSPSLVTRVGNERTNLIRNTQGIMLSQILSNTTMNHLLDVESEFGKQKAYTALDMLRDVESTLWAELDSSSPVIRADRRQLQRQYLSLLDARANQSTTDVRGLAKDSLRRIAKRIDKALARTKDERTASHLRDSRTFINNVMLGKSPASKPNFVLALPGIPAEVSILPPCFFDEPRKLTLLK